MTDTNSVPIFKKTTLADSPMGTKNRMWKSLKQILATERTLQWPEDAVTCKYIVVSVSRRIRNISLSISHVL